MKTNTVSASILAAGIVLGAGGTIASQQASADKIVSIKSENTFHKVANLTQVQPGEWVLVVCAVMHDNDGKALPETCHECEVSWPLSLSDVHDCHAKGEGLK